MLFKLVGHSESEGCHEFANQTPLEERCGDRPNPPPSGLRSPPPTELAGVAGAPAEGDADQHPCHGEGGSLTWQLGGWYLLMNVIVLVVFRFRCFCVFFGRYFSPTCLDCHVSPALASISEGKAHHIRGNRTKQLRHVFFPPQNMASHGGRAVRLHEEL